MELLNFLQLTKTLLEEKLTQNTNKQIRISILLKKKVFELSPLGNQNMVALDTVSIRAVRSLGRGRTAGAPKSGGALGFTGGGASGHFILLHWNVGK